MRRRGTKLCKRHCTCFARQPPQTLCHPFLLSTLSTLGLAPLSRLPADRITALKQFAFRSDWTCPTRGCMSAEHTFIANAIHSGNEQGRQRGFIQCLALQRPVYFWSFSVSEAAAICKGGGCVVSTRIFLSSTCSRVLVGMKERRR